MKQNLYYVIRFILFYGSAGLFAIGLTVLMDGELEPLPSVLLMVIAIMMHIIGKSQETIYNKKLEQI